MRDESRLYSSTLEENREDWSNCLRKPDRNDRFWKKASKRLRASWPTSRVPSISQSNMQRPLKVKTGLCRALLVVRLAGRDVCLRIQVVLLQLWLKDRNVTVNPLTLRRQKTVNHYPQHKWIWTKWKHILTEKWLSTWSQSTRSWLQESLLKICLRGKTQNRNESLHNVIWSRWPKTSFTSTSRVEMAVLVFVEFSFGSHASMAYMTLQGLSAGKFSVKLGTRQDIKW